MRQHGVKVFGMLIIVSAAHYTVVASGAVRKIVGVRKMAL